MLSMLSTTMALYYGHDQHCCLFFLSSIFPLDMNKKNVNWWRRGRDLRVEWQYAHYHFFLYHPSNIKKKKTMILASTHPGPCRNNSLQQRERITRGPLLLGCTLSHTNIPSSTTQHDTKRRRRRAGRSGRLSRLLDRFLDIRGGAETGDNVMDGIGPFLSSRPS